MPATVLKALCIIPLIFTIILKGGCYCPHLTEDTSLHFLWSLSSSPKFVAFSFTWILINFHQEGILCYFNNLFIICPPPQTVSSLRAKMVHCSAHVCRMTQYSISYHNYLLYCDIHPLWQISEKLPWVQGFEEGLSRSVYMWAGLCTWCCHFHGFQTRL